MQNIIEQIFSLFLLMFLGLIVYCFKKYLVASSEKDLIDDATMRKIKPQLTASISNIIVLSSGALLLGLSFITSSENKNFILREYLLLSWLLFIFSILFGILFRISLIKFTIRWDALVAPLENSKQRPLECPQREETDLEHHERLTERDKKADEVYTYLNKHTFRFETLNIILFILAIIYMAIFVLLNFYK